MTLRTVFSAILLMFAIPALSACNTVKGIGEDVEAAGEAITDTSEKTKEKM
ncbi:MAG: entericidin A/B family lipoprotein [Rickettsiales bacterium]